jgi:NitT/TauT family transport system substrate-binding protein
MKRGRYAVHSGNSSQITWSRRKFVKGLSALAGSAGLFAYDAKLVAAEPPPETTRLRLCAIPAICFAPTYLAEALLRAEGFTDIQYVKLENTAANGLRSGEVDMTMDGVGSVITSVDAGNSTVMLAGVHLGCYELFGTESVRGIRDLKGKTVAVDSLGGDKQIVLSSMAAYVGLDPQKDINWVVKPFAESSRLLAEGKVDAFLGFPPEPQEMRAKKVGHVIVKTATDKPWSEYFCCMLMGSRDFVRTHPVATKRAVRAILKAADLCAQEPKRAAQTVVAKGFTRNYDYAYEALNEVNYNAWRTYDPDDTLRFHAVRLREAGMIKSSPQTIITQGTDWRFLNQLKKELKA